MGAAGWGSSCLHASMGRSLRSGSKSGSPPQFRVDLALLTQDSFEPDCLFFRPRTSEGIEVVMQHRSLHFIEDTYRLFKQTDHRFVDAGPALPRPALHGLDDFRWEFRSITTFIKSPSLCCITRTLARRSFRESLGLE